MDRDLNTMNTILEQKEKDIESAQLPELDDEIEFLTSGKRITFDIIAIPSDPLR